MKAILLFLVLVNTLFFAWARWVAEPPGAGAAATPEPQAERIVLLREQSPPAADSEIEPLAPVIAVSDEPVVAVELPGAPAPTGSSASAPAAQPPAAQPPAAQPPAAQTPAAQTPAAEPPAAEPPAAEPVVEPVVGVAAAAPDIAASAPELAAAPRRCVSIGPFSKPAQAELASTILGRAGGRVRERREAGQIWVGHWVHLAPAASRDAAVVVVEKLREDGVSDIYIETSKPLRNAISLGLFSDASRAEIRAGKLRKLGVRPQIRDRFRDGERIWLDVDLPQDAAVNLADYQLGPIELELRERDCAAAS